MHHTEHILARGARTGIRYFTRDDVDEWANWPPHGDPLFRDYNPPKLSPLERDLWYSEKRARPDHIMFAIVDEHDALIGRLFLRQINRNDLSAVLGIDLRSDRLDEGRGTDALRTFLEYFFGDMGFRTLKLDVAAYNSRAQHVYEKLGWVYVGQHWNTYPSTFAPEVFSEPRYESIREFFRAGPAVVSVLHYDMELTKARWEEMRANAS